MDKSDNANTYDYRIAHNSGTGFRFRVGPNSAYVDSGAVTANAWHTVFAWQEAANNTINIQVDNGPVTTVGLSSKSTDSSNPLSIGAFPNGSTELDGRIDEVAIYKRVLTAQERTWLYNSGQGRSYAEVTPSAPSALTYTYGDTAHKHAVTAFAGNTYQYDANGNMKQRVVNGQTFALAYDAENRLVTVCADANANALCDSGETPIASFVYDGDGNRVKSVLGNETTLFIGNYYQETTVSSVTTITKYYYAGATRVAMRVNGTLSYILPDHLGSTSITTNDQGVKISELRYKAWGEVRYTSGTTPTDYTYTGQYSDSYINLLWYGSRHYDPELGRFIQPDSIVPTSTQGVQAWDRYAYANNNPVRYIDPSGHCISDPFSFFVCAMVAGAIIDGVANAISQSRETGHIDPREVLDHTVEGAAIGGGVVIAAVAVTALLPAASIAVPAACADGDCANEAVAIGNAITNTSQALSADGDPTNEIVAATQNTTTAIVPYYPPNDGAAGEIVEAVAPKGQILSRLGGPGGNYLSPQGTPIWARSLPYVARNLPERLYQVTNQFTYYASKAAPWFGQPGGGIQYRILPTVQWLLDNEYLKDFSK
jgi:RHS repeat-associated protein